MKLRAKYRTAARLGSKLGGRNHNESNGTDILTDIFWASDKRIRMYESNFRNVKGNKMYIYAIANFIKRGGIVDLLLSENFVRLSGDKGKYPRVANNLIRSSERIDGINVRVARADFQNRLKTVNPKIADFTLGDNAVRLETDINKNTAYYNYNYSGAKIAELKQMFDEEMVYGNPI